jgi:hypothetical protein
LPPVPLELEAEVLEELDDFPLPVEDPDAAVDEPVVTALELAEEPPVDPRWGAALHATRRLSERGTATIITLAEENRPCVGRRDMASTSS